MPSAQSGGTTETREKRLLAVVDAASSPFLVTMIFVRWLVDCCSRAAGRRLADRALWPWRSCVASTPVLRRACRGVAVGETRCCCRSDLG